MKSFLRTLAVVAIVFAAHGTAHAQKSWNVSTGLWNTAGNWSPSGVPGSADAVSIANSGTASLDTSGTISSLSIGSGSLLQKDNANGARTLNSGSATGGFVTNFGTIRYGTGTGTFLIASGSSGWNNSGLITSDGAGQTLSLLVTGNNTATNSGTVAADGGILSLSQANTSQSFNIANSGGLLRATSSGTITIASGVAITGGSLSIDAGSVFRHNRLNTSTVLTDVTVTNAGRMFTESTGSRFTINFLGTTTLANSGTLEFLTSGAATPIASGTAASSTTITNQATGLIRVANNNTSGTGTALFQINTPNFTNLGRIVVSSSAGLTTGTSQLRSGTNVSNAGSILVDGPVSSIEMGVRTFTQTAGSLSLVNGGWMTAGSVLINSGTLLGTGTINAPVTIGGILAPGVSGSTGTLTVSNAVTWNGGQNWLFDLGVSGTSKATPGTSDLLSLTGTFTKGTGSTFTFDFANSGTDGWYKLANYASTNFTTGTFTSGSGQFAGTNLPTGKTANFVVDSTALYVQIVPEPSTLALAGLGIGLAGFVAYRRRRG